MRDPFQAQIRDVPRFPPVPVADTPLPRLPVLPSNRDPPCVSSRSPSPPCYARLGTPPFCSRRPQPPSQSHGAQPMPHHTCLPSIAHNVACWLPKGVAPPRPSWRAAPRSSGASPECFAASHPESNAGFQRHVAVAARKSPRVRLSSSHDRRTPKADIECYRATGLGPEQTALCPLVSYQWRPHREAWADSASRSEPGKQRRG
jgi:hypothetical protein